MGFIRRRLVCGGRREVHADTYIDDIVEHLRTLLSARRGAAWFMDDFGLDLTSARTPEQLLLLLEEQVRVNLERYEPRVAIVSMDEVHVEDSIHLSVLCKVVARDLWIRVAVSAVGLQIEALNVDPSASEE